MKVQRQRHRGREATRAKRRAGVLLGTSMLVLASAGTLVVGQGVASAQSAVVLSLASFEKGQPSTGPFFGGLGTIDYQIQISNAGDGASGPVNVFATIAKDARYVDGTAGCGNLSGCTIGMTNPPRPQLVWSIPSVPPSSQQALTFSLRSGGGSLYQVIPEVAHWSGDGCPKSVCATNHVAIRVFPRPVTVNSFPFNNASTPTGGTINYTLAIRNNSGAVQRNVVITDPIPAGATYVDSSASCNKVQACSVTVAGGVVTYTLSSVPPAARKPFKVGYSVTASATSGTIVNTGTWVGDQCDFPTPCAMNVNTIVVDNTPTPEAPGETGHGSGGGTGGGGGTGTGSGGSGPSTAGGSGSGGSTSSGGSGPSTAVTGPLAHTGVGEMLVWVLGSGLAMVLLAVGMLSVRRRGNRQISSL